MTPDLSRQAGGLVTSYPAFCAAAMKRLDIARYSLHACAAHRHGQLFATMQSILRHWPATTRHTTCRVSQVIFVLLTPLSSIFSIEKNLGTVGAEIGSKA